MRKGKKPTSTTKPVTMSGNMLSAIRSTGAEKLDKWKSSITDTDEYGDYNLFADLKSFLDIKAQNNIFYQQLGTSKNDQKLIEGAKKHFKHTKQLKTA